MNKEQIINSFELSNLDLKNLPDGANYIVNNDMKPVGIIMNIQYYKYLEQLMLKLKDKIVSLDKTRKIK